MASSGKKEIEKFNGQSFELWKLKMEDLLVDKYQWIMVDPGTKPTGLSDEEWKKLDQKAKSTIRLCVSDLVLLNVLGEAIVKALWDKLGTLYQSKSLVNKLFLWKKLYNLRMKDGDLVTEHLNAFNIVVSQLSYIDIKILDEDKCINLLCSLPDSWDSLGIAIGSNATALQFDEIVSSLLMEKMRQKNMDSQNGDALSAVCWKCRKAGHYKRDYKSKAPEKGQGYDDAPSTDAKTTSVECGDVYLASSSTHVNHEAWLIDSSASFHFTPHREWFCKYEKYDGGDVFLGDDRKARIIGRRKAKLKFSVVLEIGVENLVVFGEKTMPWNQRLGHIGEKGLQILHGKGMVEGMGNSSLDFDFCENCVYGKQNRVIFPSGGKRKQILKLVHSDVFGPVKVPSLGKSVYYVSFIDDFSRNTWIYFLKKKSEVFDRFKEFKALVENQIEKKIKVLRIDNDGEFAVRNLKNDVRSVVYHGKILLHIHLSKMELQKEMNKTLMEGKESMLSGVGLGHEI
eukprot:PITA_30226